MLENKLKAMKSEKILDKIQKIKEEQERTNLALKQYEEELERRKQEAPLGVPLENIMLAHVGGVYKYAFESEDSKLVFDKWIEEYVKALQKLAKGESIDIKVLLPLLPKGWIAMDDDKRWFWYKEQPTIDNDKNVWVNLNVCDTLTPFNIKPASDWKNSLMECGL